MMFETQAPFSTTSKHVSDRSSPNNNDSGDSGLGFGQKFFANGNDKFM
jgi:hypothetical protein